MTPDQPPRGPIRGPVDAQTFPRYAGLATFARLPQIGEVPDFDIAILGVPFDNGGVYRLGARFGPSAIRQASRLLRPYHPGLAVDTFGTQQLVDAGDVGCNPLDIMQAIADIEAAADEILSNNARILSLGGDHTIVLPLLRSVCRRFGRVALIHFDAHFDTWDAYFGQRFLNGTPLRRAAEEDLFFKGQAIHVGIRGPVYGESDFADDAALGFRVITAMDIEDRPISEHVATIRETIGDGPVYISIDMDVLDPGNAPGVGVPEAGGLTTRELLRILRGLSGLHIVGADVVEVSPPFDQSEVTAVAAAHVSYELLALMVGTSP
jgi:agmatinase